MRSVVQHWNFGRGVVLAARFLGLTGLLLGMGCANVFAPPARYDYFVSPSLSDPWTPKIAGWQHRERADQGEPVAAVPAVGEGGDLEAASVAPGQALRAKYFSFRADRRREMARDVADWIQAQAKRHYIPDGPIDHWATLEETLRSNGDDCDGLELLVYHALRDLGFSHREVFRAIVYRPADGQHHMVTLWFEEPDDPWVIDPTGAMTSGFRRMSDVPGWVPLKLFSDDTEYSVQPDHAATGARRDTLVTQR